VKSFEVRPLLFFLWSAALFRSFCFYLFVSPMECGAIPQLCFSSSVSPVECGAIPQLLSLVFCFWSFCFSYRRETKAAE